MSRTLLTWPAADEANPYVLRLSAALTARGVSVRHARHLAAHCARPRGARWLHVHWPEWMTQHPSPTAYRARIAWQTTLLDAARTQGVSLAWTAHNLFGHDDPHPELGRRAREALLRRCAVVFGHFPSAEHDLRALGFQGRFAWAAHPHYDADYPQPFADESARRDFRRALGVDDDALLLVSAGAIEGYKNLPALAAALRDASPSKLRWVVAGRAGHAASVDALRAMAPSLPWMTLRTGFLPRGEMARLLAAADAALLGYRDFYTSGAAVLALTLGTPVVAPPRHHLALYAGEAFLVPLEAVTPAALEAALAALRAMPADARAAARRRALTDTWEAAAAVVDATLFGV